MGGGNYEVNDEVMVQDMTLAKLFPVADPGFSIRGGGGGAQKITRTSRGPKSLTAGVHLEALGVFLMLFRAIWALFLSILIQTGIKKHI